jgi:hypothetical protein
VFKKQSWSAVMSDVKQQLAECKCEAAPHGWSDRTKGGQEVVNIQPDNVGGFVGFVKSRSGTLCAVNWDGSGVDHNIKNRLWNLVALPDPATSEVQRRPGIYRKLAYGEVAQLLPLWHASSDQGRAIREVVESRVTIAKQAAEIERLQQDHDGLMVVQNTIENDNLKLAAERDAAIDIARRLRNGFPLMEHLSADARCLVEEFDRQHHDSSPRGDDPQTCDDSTPNHMTPT